LVASWDTLAAYGNGPVSWSIGFSRRTAISRRTQQPPQPAPDFPSRRVRL